MYLKVLESAVAVIHPYGHAAVTRTTISESISTIFKKKNISDAAPAGKFLFNEPMKRNGGGGRPRKTVFPVWTSNIRYTRDVGKVDFLKKKNKNHFRLKQ